LSEHHVFITRSTLSRDRGCYERHPEQPSRGPVEEKMLAAFERFGLPDLLD
jgi:hypothetical protein